MRKLRFKEEKQVASTNERVKRKRNLGQFGSKEHGFMHEATLFLAGTA